MRILDSLSQIEIALVLERLTAMELNVQVRLHWFQISAAIFMWAGEICALPTGSGKTYAIMLAAALLSNTERVIVVTSNRDLSIRDFKGFAKVFPDIESSIALAENKAVTFCDYETAAFSYLRAELNPREYFMIIDEIDAAMIDNSSTGYSISLDTIPSEYTDAVQATLTVISSLKLEEMDTTTNVNIDDVCEWYSIDGVYSDVDIMLSTVAESRALAQLSQTTLLPYRVLKYILQCTLIAKFVLQESEHYIIRNRTIYILNRNSGYTSSGSEFEYGIHTALELLHNCDIKDRANIGSTLSYAKYVKYFKGFAGCSGTAQFYTEEFATIYGKQVEDYSTFFPETISVCELIVTSLGDASKLLPTLLSENPYNIIITKSERDLLHLQRLGIKGYAIGSWNSEDTLRIDELLTTYGLILSTPVCGRGVDIANKLNPTVIQIGHLSKSQSRQVQGRTGRQGGLGVYYKVYCTDDTQLRLRNQSVTALTRWRIRQRETVLAEQQQSSRIRTSIFDTIISCMQAYYEKLAQQISGLNILSVRDNFSIYEMEAREIWQAMGSPYRPTDVNMFAFLVRIQEILTTMHKDFDENEEL